MKINSSFWTAAAIILILNAWAITSIRSSLYNDGNSPAAPTLSTSEISVTLLLMVVLDMTTLFYLISKAPSWHTTNQSTAPHKTASVAKVYTAARVIPKVKSHPLPPLRR